MRFPTSSGWAFNTGPVLPYGCEAYTSSWAVTPMRTVYDAEVRSVYTQNEHAMLALSCIWEKDVHDSAVTKQFTAADMWKKWSNYTGHSIENNLYKEIYKRFQCIFLGYYEASFPVIDYKSMIMTGLQKVSNYHVPKSEFYSLYGDNKDYTQIRYYYKKYYNLTKESNIWGQRKQYFHNQIAASSNKVKAAWKIINKNLETVNHMTW